MRFPLTALVIIAANCAFAQAPLVKEPNFNSPNAASLGKYGDIPVSYHTGVPEISIPIHSIEEGPLRMPISISYHSSGIRVEEVSTNVGLGWSLNAGGMITRTIQGGPDEGIQYGTMDGALSPYVGWGWYKDMGMNPQITACGPTPLLVNSPSGPTPWSRGCASLYWEAGKGYVDCEPDLFTYNFNGYTGKFFFDAARKVHMIPETDVVVEPINSPTNFYAWKIIAPDGATYFFGGTVKEVSCSDPTQLSNNKHVASSTTWYLYKVESLNGESVINLEYVDDTYSFGNRSGQSSTFRTRSFYVDPQHTYQPGDPLAYPAGPASSVLGVTIVDGKRLTRITTGSNNTTIDFTASIAARTDLSRYEKTGGVDYYDPVQVNTLSKSLQFITITTPSLCRKFELSQDYFPASTTCAGCVFGATIDEKRLRLNWIRESDCNSIVLPKYEFTYNSSPLPKRYSLGRDLWGYYNGADSNTGLLETYNNPVLGTTITMANSRVVHELSAQAGILTKIKYPTGGATEFTYESHRETSSGPLIGGLRIKSMQTSDDFGVTMTKNYQYDSGKLYLNPSNYKYSYANNNSIYTNAALGNSDFGIAYSSNPFPPMWSSQGYNIGYTHVKVIEPGNGYTKYSYNNNSPIYVDPGRYPLKPSIAVLGTSQQKAQSYHKEGNTDDNIFVASSSLKHLPTSVPVQVVARKVMTVMMLNCGFDCNFGLWMDYEIPTSRYNLTRKTEVRDGVSTVTNYTYGNTHNGAKSSQFTDSEGNVRITQTTYPDDAGSGAPASMYNPSDTYFKNLRTSPVEERNLVNGVLKGKTTYQYTQIANRLLLTSSRKYPTGTTDYVEDLYRYDDNSNLTGIVKSNGTYKAFFWGYQNKLPIAAVDFPTLYSDGVKNVFHTSFEDETTNVLLDAKTGRKSFKSTTVYTKLLNGLSNGSYTLSYFVKSGAGWNYQESTISVSSGSYSISIPANTQVDELRFFPKGSQMKTYTYDLGSGVTSVTNPGSVVQYYQYDSSGRLKFILNDKKEIVKMTNYYYKLN